MGGRRKKRNERKRQNKSCSGNNCCEKTDGVRRASTPAFGDAQERRSPEETCNSEETNKVKEEELTQPLQTEEPPLERDNKEVNEEKEDSWRDMANNNADSSWTRPPIKAIQLQECEKEPLYEPPGDWSDDSQLLEIGKVVGVLHGSSSSPCTSCGPRAKDQEDPLLFTTTFVASPFRQFPSETTLHSRSSSSFHSRSPSVPPPPISPSDNEEESYTGGGGGKPLLPPPPPPNLPVEEWPLPPVPSGEDEEEGDDEDDFEISREELDDQVRYERMTFISGSSANEEEDDTDEDPPKIPPHQVPSLWDMSDKAPSSNTGTIRRKGKRTRNLVNNSNNNASNSQQSHNLSSNHLEHGDSSDGKKSLHRRNLLTRSSPDNLSESSASFHENDARVVVMSSVPSVCETVRDRNLRESWQSSGSEYQGSLASGGTSSMTDPSSLTPQPSKPNLFRSRLANSSSKQSLPRSILAEVPRHSRYDSESTSGCSSRTRSRNESKRSRDGTPEDESNWTCSLPPEVGVSDAVDLESSDSNENGLLKNLQTRFKKGQIYTNVGPILVSINPYKKLPLYTPEVIDAYRKQCLYQLPPHIYSITDRAWRALRDTGEDQSILLSGETGSGKTEASKLILQYLAAATGHSQEFHAIKYKILQANPILEAFGNARTSSNNNSSRFGKYMEIVFDFKGDPVGGNIHNYLLEKFRVTMNFSNGERNFHIFYQLLSGVDMQMLKDLYLQRSIDDYVLLIPKNTLSTTSQAHHLEVINAQEDRKDFIITKKAMEDVGLTSEEIFDIFSIVSAVLKLGNLQFLPDTNMDGTEGCSIGNDYELYDVCELLSGEVSNLQSGLLTRSIESKGETLVTDLSASEAAHSRDTLCRALYTRLFTWIVNRINESIKVRASRRYRNLGILDLYGFETLLSPNGFEQLIINFANEKLHQIILDRTLFKQQEENVSEGIEWTNVDFFSNISIVSLIEQSGKGILSTLDEICHQGLLDTQSPLFGSFSEMDNHFLNSLRTSDTCKGHPHLETPDLERRRKKEDKDDSKTPSHCFRIKHFAGTVTYDVRGFSSHNTDSLDRDLSIAMYECDHSLLKVLFPEGNPKRSSRRRPASAGTQFKISIGALLKSLESKSPHFIRCLKPNEDKKSKNFEISILQHQIRYSCLIEMMTLYRNGYSYRLEYESFLDHYKMLSAHTWPYWNGSSVDGVTYLLRELPISANDYSFGRTKIFIRSLNTVEILEELRKERLEELCIMIQKTWRGHKDRQKWNRIRNAQIVISNFWRRWKNKSHIVELKQRRQEEWASIVVQRTFKSWQRRRFLHALAHNLPSESPLAKEWPHSPFRFLKESNALLRRLYHKWRCYRYRLRFDQIARNRMREKVTASIIFKDRKASYYRSINHPFLGDYVRLRQNPQWKKICTETNDQYVVFADIINKITRSNAKFVPILFVISTSSMLIMDQRTMQIKYRIPASEIYKLSLSPYYDDIAVFHVRASSPMREMRSQAHIPGCLSSESMKRKGDFVLQTGHVIEIVTKLFLVIQNATGKPPTINIETEFEANFGTDSVVFDFKSSGSDSHDGQHSSSSHGASSHPTHVKLVKRKNKMEVIF